MVRHFGQVAFGCVWHVRDSLCLGIQKLDPPFARICSQDVTPKKKQSDSANEQVLASG